MELNAVTVGIIAALSALVGVVVTSAFTLVTTYMNNKSEERKHNRSLIMQIGFDYWKEHIAFAKVATERSGQRATIPPPEAYILFMLKLSEELLSSRLTNEDIKQRLESATDTFDLVIDHVQNRDKKRKPLK